MTSRPPSSSSTSRPPPPRPSQAHPTPHHTVPRSRSTSSHRAPPQAPKPSRRPTAEGNVGQAQPVFNLAAPSLVPRASCGKPDDILAPPDAQSCPFAKAGLKVLGIGPGPYGELEGWLEWPNELYANERKQAHIQREIKAIYTQDERLRANDTTNRLLESLKSKVDKLKEDEWMYSSTDTLFKGERQNK